MLDNGAGIPPEKVGHLNPFVSSKGTRGTGLGLPVDRKILRKHGGDILGCRVQVGVGSKFTLRCAAQSPLSGDPGSSGEMPILPPEAN